ncbi:hypothetical protein EFK50_09310 [Nocardioides marmoriginsengisoli]|uniref:Uncharacterized protein n=1 Tax=Nocardioides marmoriginsengisoli TaxID=661483 RepID=A0A3N0CEZ3_9ACTN|nr:hypothetical protein EFK50_09310 [Nocardioides marmoriginsengisoli]
MALNDATTTRGRIEVWRDGTICGKTREQLEKLGAEYEAPVPATGWFRVSEIEYGAYGNAIRFAATYEVNCQYVAGPPGYEGSVAVNGSLAPVPPAPPTPGPVTGLKAVNEDPFSWGYNTTTLTWNGPAGFDVNLERIQSSNHAKLHPVINAFDTLQYRGRAGRYVEGKIDFMDTRTYRALARGATGRLGPMTLLTVLGTRLSIPEPKQRITIGDEATFSGRLTEAWDYVRVADVMKGPPLAGRTVVLCRQSVLEDAQRACVPVDRTTTDADGRFTLSARPLKNSRYDIAVPPTPTMLGNSSRVINANVSPHADLRASAAEQNARSSVRRGSVIRFTTSRARAGSRGFIRLQRYDGRTWRTVATKKLGTGGKRLAVPYREHKRGLQAYRVVKPGDAHHVNGYSRTVRVRVR